MVGRSPYDQSFKIKSNKKIRVVRIFFMIYTSNKEYNMENLHDYSSYIALNEAAVSGFTLDKLCDDLRKKKVITAKTPSAWPLIPQSKFKAGEKSFSGSIMVNGKPLTPSTTIKSTDTISVKDGSIQFDDIKGFGQAELVVKGGVPTLSVSTN